MSLIDGDSRENHENSGMGFEGFFEGFCCCSSMEERENGDYEEERQWGF